MPVLAVYGNGTLQYFTYTILTDTLAAIHKIAGRAGLVPLLDIGTPMHSLDSLSDQLREIFL